MEEEYEEAYGEDHEAKKQKLKHLHFQSNSESNVHSIYHKLYADSAV